MENNKSSESEFEEQISFFDSILGINEDSEEESNDVVQEVDSDLTGETVNNIIDETSPVIEEKVVLNERESAMEKDEILENVVDENVATEEVENQETEISFEDALKELDKIVQDLQRSDIALDKSMELFRRGTSLIQSSRKQLSEAEQEVKELLDNGEEVDFE